MPSRSGPRMPEPRPAFHQTLLPEASTARATSRSPDAGLRKVFAPTYTRPGSRPLLFAHARFSPLLFIPPPHLLPSVSRSPLYEISFFRPHPQCPPLHAQLPHAARRTTATTNNANNANKRFVARTFRPAISPTSATTAAISNTPLRRPTHAAAHAGSATPPTTTSIQQQQRRTPSTSWSSETTSSTATNNRTCAKRLQQPHLQRRLRETTSTTSGDDNNPFANDEPPAPPRSPARPPAQRPRAFPVQPTPRRPSSSAPPAQSQTGHRAVASPDCGHMPIPGPASAALCSLRCSHHARATSALSYLPPLALELPNCSTCLR
jgi:hypothetical protein